jgi:hypothetical protein
MAVPKGKPFIRHINGDLFDDRDENRQWTADTINSDADLFDRETQRAMLAAAQIEEDESRDLVVETIFSLALNQTQFTSLLYKANEVEASDRE